MGRRMAGTLQDDTGDFVYLSGAAIFALTKDHYGPNYCN